jgi:hypothetical protein
MSKFANKVSGRPTSFFNAYQGPLTRRLTPIHPHEFGPGYDIQYKDSRGKVQAELHGLSPGEAAYLKMIKKM